MSCLSYEPMCWKDHAHIVCVFVGVGVKCSTPDMWLMCVGGVHSRECQ